MNITLTSDYITLGQLLKSVDFIQSGGEAKYAVKELDIKVNGNSENRRGKKLYRGDIILIEGKQFTIV